MFHVIYKFTFIDFPIWILIDSLKSKITIKLIKIPLHLSYYPSNRLYKTTHQFIYISLYLPSVHKHTILHIFHHLYYMKGILLLLNSIMFQLHIHFIDHEPILLCMKHRSRTYRSLCHEIKHFLIHLCLNKL